MHITDPNKAQVNNLKSTITNYKSCRRVLTNDSLNNDYVRYSIHAETTTKGIDYRWKPFCKDEPACTGQRISRREIVTNVSPFPKERKNGGEDERGLALESERNRKTKDFLETIYRPRK